MKSTKRYIGGSKPIKHEHKHVFTSGEIDKISKGRFLS